MQILRLLLLTLTMFTLQKLFYKKVGIGRGSSKTKKKKKTTEEVVSKHSGILGLCAFVNAFPYDVPDFVPDILMVLSDHLHDPQPIPVIIMTFFKLFFLAFFGLSFMVFLMMCQALYHPVNQKRSFQFLLILLPAQLFLGLVS